LKAEHGTGLNMAPFVQREWGERATELMWRIKQLADPGAVLGPGIVLNRDPKIHLRNLKSAPQIEPVANQCIECGFCEPVCPSRELTTTPRQRIVLRREMARQAAGSPVLAALLEQYDYDAVQTCAADGSCSLSCPVGIDTGKLVKELRSAQHGERSRRAGLLAARRYRLLEAAARTGLRGGRLLGDRAGAGLTAALRAVLGEERVPAWSSALPGPAPPLPWSPREGAAAVYFPACVNRIFGNPREQHPRPSLPEALLSVSARAGRPLWIPPGTAGLCCGTPFASKGYRAGHELMARRVAEAILSWTEGGLLPLVIDASSCALGLIGEVPEALEEQLREEFARVRVLDSIAWAHDELLPALEVHGRVPVASVHPPCAAAHLGLTGKLTALTGALAEEVRVPASGTCCGTAGDRGLLHPELPAAATAAARAELDAEGPVSACLCSNRTCEIGLTQASGRSYGSFVLLLEELTRPGSAAAA
ncbi:MAG: (Fe-S)-binding protein, partial [Solirubrobacteraceae bacterium]